MHPSVHARTSTVARRTSPDRLVVVFSDIEMGGGGPFDDFPHSTWLGNLIAGLAKQEPGLKLDVVFNGDTFDFLKTAVDNQPHYLIDATIALAKLARIESFHSGFFSGIGRLLADRPNTNVHFIEGNHDAEVAFPEVRARMAQLCGDPARVHFPGCEMDIGRLHIEHGSQLDSLFQIDPKKPLIDYEGRKILNLPWASVLLIETMLPLQPVLYHHDRCKPRPLVLQILPEVRELLRQSLWDYWTKRYLPDAMRRKDPLKRMSFTMARELGMRLLTHNVEVSMSSELEQRMERGGAFDLTIIGHQHEPALWSHGGRRAMRTGAFRDEYVLNNNASTQTPTLKTYVEAYLSGEHVVRSQMVEIDGPEPEAPIPTIFDTLALVRSMLSTPTARREREEAQQALLKAERT